MLAALALRAGAWLCLADAHDGPWSADADAPGRRPAGSRRDPARARAAAAPYRPAADVTGDRGEGERGERDERDGAAADDAATDDALMAALAAGGPGRDPALQALVRRHGAAVHAVVLGVTDDAHLAQDVAQEVFLRVYLARERWVPGRGPLRPWLLRIARNQALNARRGRARRPAAALGDDEAAVPDRGPAPDAPAEGRDEAAALDAALARLPRGDREVIALRYQEGLGYDAIGDVVGAGPGAVRQRVWRALERLRGLLGAGGRA